jgi:hypothetical protein
MKLSRHTVATFFLYFIKYLGGYLHFQDLLIVTWLCCESMIPWLDCPIAFLAMVMAVALFFGVWIFNITHLKFSDSLQERWWWRFLRYFSLCSFSIAYNLGDWCMCSILVRIHFYSCFICTGTVVIIILRACPSIAFVSSWSVSPEFAELHRILEIS